MLVLDRVLEIADPATGQRWSLPHQAITAVDAEVSERWMVNLRVHPRRFRELVPAPFLRPQLVGGWVVAALCAIRMRHVAPIWAPLALGPACMNAALRVACLDADGTPCVWVAERFTDSGLAPALASLGFPAVTGGLRDRGTLGRLDLEAGGGLLDTRLVAGRGHAAELFPDAAALGAFIAAGVRSYAPGLAPGIFDVIDLEKRSDNAFAAVEGIEGWVRTPWGDLTVDGVYRTVEGLYRWTCHGRVDGAGHAV